MLIGNKTSGVGNQILCFPYQFVQPLQMQEGWGFIRCLVEIGLASNAPTKLKTQVPIPPLLSVPGS